MATWRNDFSSLFIINLKIHLREISIRPFCIISVLIHSQIQRPIDELRPASAYSLQFDPFIGHINRRGKNQLTVGLPLCNMNSKVQILGKSEVFSGRTETHFRQTNISRDLLSVCEVRRSDKCSSISIFAVIYLKLLFQIDSLLPSKEIAKTFLDAKTIAKTGQTTPNKFCLMTSLHCGQHRKMDPGRTT